MYRNVQAGGPLAYVFHQMLAPSYIDIYGAHAGVKLKPLATNLSPLPRSQACLTCVRDGQVCMGI